MAMVSHNLTLLEMIREKIRHFGWVHPALAQMNEGSDQVKKQVARFLVNLSLDGK